MVLKWKSKPGTLEDLDEQKVSEMLESVSSGEELLKHAEAILTCVENSLILALSTVSELDTMALSPDEIMGRIAPLMDKQEFLYGRVQEKLKRIAQLPDGATACDDLNMALAERLNAYGSEVQYHLKRMGIQPPNM